MYSQVFCQANILASCVMLLALDGARGADPEWNYRLLGPSMWVSQGYSSCGGSNQSPINLDPSSATSNPDLAAQLVFNEESKADSVQFRLVNTGTNVQAELTDATSPLQVSTPCAWDGDAIKTWQLQQFHWHWGGSDVVGSEHTLDKERFPMEMHMLYWNMEYANFSNAKSHADGLLVLSYLFKTGSVDNDIFSNITALLPEIGYKGNTSVVSSIDIDGLISGSASHPFYYYRGGMTTSGCDEVVTWIVFEQPITISRDQADAFRQLHFNALGAAVEEEMVDNFRSTQATNGRHISYSSDGSTRVSTYSCVLSSLIISLITHIKCY